MNTRILCSGTSFKTSSAEKILLCIMISMTSVFYFYEEQYPHPEIINITLFAVMSAVWLISSFYAGKDGQKSFAVFALIYWNIPYMFTIYYSARDNIGHYSRLLSMTNRICRALISAPFAYISDISGISAGAFPVLLLACSAASFTAGMYIARSAAEKEDNADDIKNA